MCMNGNNAILISHVKIIKYLQPLFRNGRRQPHFLELSHDNKLTQGIFSTYNKIQAK